MGKTYRDKNKHGKNHRGTDDYRRRKNKGKLDELDELDVKNPNRYASNYSYEY